MSHVAVCTPLYNTPPETLARTWASLKNQTYSDWTWWVWDDSTHDGPWRQLWGLCGDERYRIVPMRGMGNVGSIGEVKRRLFMAADGDVVLELDHDDELTPDCLAEVVDAFEADPTVGFVYSDWAEINPLGEWCRYPDGWGFGFGGQYKVDGRWVMSAPPINDVTMSHIVSAPNHVRAWRSSVYRELGGHSSSMSVADDYELLVRTFLMTNMFHIPKPLYKQFISPLTAQRQRNGLIQRLVAETVDRYRDQIRDRAEALGCLVR